jgi:hypothetical protein
MHDLFVPGDPTSAFAVHDDVGDANFRRSTVLVMSVVVGE